MIKNVYRSSCKISVILFNFSETSIFSTDFRGKNPQICNLMKLSGESRFVTCGRTDGLDEANTVIPRLTSDPANDFFG